MPRLLTSLFVLGAGALAGCSGALPCDPATSSCVPGASDRDASLPMPGNDPVENSLRALGVNTDITPRVDEDGAPLDETHSPLGTRQTINQFSEILLFGVNFDEEGHESMHSMPLIDLAPEGERGVRTRSLGDFSVPELAPLYETRAARTATTGDFDADGLDEVAVFFQEEDQPLKMRLVDASGALVGEDATVITLDEAHLLSSATGDLDGNGTLDIALAAASDDVTRLLLLLNDDGRFTVQDVAEVPRLSAYTTSIAVRTGNLDYDAGDEIGLVVNEGDSSARYFLFDDASSRGDTLDTLASGPVEIDFDDGSRRALGANLVFGDVDGDHLDEVILGGLSSTGNIRNNLPTYLFTVLDDAHHALVHLHSRAQDSELGPLQPQASGAEIRMDNVQLVALDLDGDGADEIVTNQFIFDDGRDAGFAPLAEVPLADMYSGRTGGRLEFDFSTTSFAGADVNSDRREDLIFFVQRYDSPGPDLQVWSMHQALGFIQTTSLSTDFHNYSDTLMPLVLPMEAEVDNHSMALSYSEGSHRLIFTEPVILAALAAAPCAEDLGQDLDNSCRTAFGQGTSESTEETTTWSVTVGISVGFDATVPFVGGPEAVLDTTNVVRGFGGSAYTLSKTVTYETGALEDAVVFTSVPFDVYSYEVLSHPNPEIVGQVLEVRIPREPITTMVTRDYYNEHAETGAPLIDNAVFAHQAGTVDSYPTRSERDQILRSYPGVQDDEPHSVGEGGGQTTSTIREFDETLSGSSFEVSAVLNLRATAGGVVGGFSIGGGVGATLRTSHGTDTIYQGSVGNISRDAFDQGDTYQWGLFAYIYDDPATGQSYEVLNYWVER